MNKPTDSKKRKFANLNETEAEERRLTVNLQERERKCKQGDLFIKIHAVLQRNGASKKLSRTEILTQAYDYILELERRDQVNKEIILQLSQHVGYSVTTKEGVSNVTGPAHSLASDPTPVPAVAANGETSLSPASQTEYIESSPSNSLSPSSVRSDVITKVKSPTQDADRNYIPICEPISPFPPETTMRPAFLSEEQPAINLRSQTKTEEDTFFEDFFPLPEDRRSDQLTSRTCSVTTKDGVSNVTCPVHSLASDPTPVPAVATNGETSLSPASPTEYIESSPSNSLSPSCIRSVITKVKSPTQDADRNYLPICEPISPFPPETTELSINQSFTTSFTMRPAFLSEEQPATNLRSQAQAKNTFFEDLFPLTEDLQLHLLNSSKIQF